MQGLIDDEVVVCYYPMMLADPNVGPTDESGGDLD